MIFLKKIVAFSGKGGVGKTTSLVLFLKYLIDSKKAKDILVIDSDPDANVADVIGVVDQDGRVGGRPVADHVAILAGDGQEEVERVADQLAGFAFRAGWGAEFLLIVRGSGALFWHTGNILTEPME